MALVLFNGLIHTLDSALPRATALAIQGDRVLAAGSDDEIRALAGPQSQIINLNGRTIIPGLTDSHLHFEWYSLGLRDVNVRTDTKQEALRRVTERAERTPKQEWIFGRGWNQSGWGDGSFPTASDLDTAAPYHPVYLIAQSGHAGWANTLALKRVGVADGTPDPPGGEFQRDASGRLTGIMFEEACWAFREAMPHETEEEVAGAMLPAFENAWKVGLTGVHDFDGVRCFVAYQLLKERGQLGLRVIKNIPVAHLEHAIGVGLRSGFGDHWLRIGNVKLFADGALGPRSAAMYEPYEGEPENRGIVISDKEEIYEKASLAAKHGLAMTVHAIGDRANHDLFDVYEKLRQEEVFFTAEYAEIAEKNAIKALESSAFSTNTAVNSRSVQPLRHRAEHLQVLHPDDLGRAARLKIIASMQPIHATSDMKMVDRYWGARGKNAYTFRTQLESGATLAFGSDAPVESFNPFWGIHAAVTRRRGDGSPGPEGWYPEQRLTVAEALRGYTYGPAFAGNMERDLGSLSPGKLADLVVLDRDIFACDPMEIRDTQVFGTMIGGEWKWNEGIE